MLFNRMRRNGSGTKGLRRGLPLLAREHAMTAALSTIAVLSLLWFVSALILQMLDESGGKMLAALKGRSPLATTPAVQPISWKVTSRSRAMRPLRARPTLRAAA